MEADMESTFRPEDLIDAAERVRGLARRLVADESTAADLVQDACVAAIERPPRGGTPAGPWFVRVVRNLAARTHRDRSRRTRREERAARSETVPATSHVAAELDTHRRLVEAVDRLAEPYRTAIVLRFFDGILPREIASRMNAPAATVSTWVHRGLARLRDDLTDDRQPLAVVLLPLLGLDRAPAPGAPLVLTGAAATGALMSAKKIALGSAALVLLGLGITGAVLVTRPSAGTTTNVDGGATDLAATDRQRVDRARDVAGTNDADVTHTAPDALRPPPPPVDLQSCDRTLDLFGRIVDEDGTPITGAAIRTDWCPWIGVGAVGIQNREERETGPSAVSAVDGTYALRLTRGVRVDLRVTADGFAELRLEHRQAGERSDIVLRRGASLSVSVRDAAGAAVPGATVEARTLRHTVGSTYDGIGQTLAATSDESGVATVIGLAAGWARVSVSDAVSGVATYESVDVPVTGRVEIDVTIPLGASVTGRVTDAATGASIESARVGSLSVDAQTELTDAEGRYESSAWTRTTLIQVAAEGYLTVTRRVGETEVIDFALEAGDSLVARLLLPDGSPASGALVAVRAPWSEGRRAVRLMARADADGRIALSGLRHDAAHTMTVHADGAGRTTIDFDPPAAPRGTVDLGDVVLPIARRVEGAVTDSGGRPITRVWVTLSAVADDRGPRPSGAYSVSERRRTDDLGRFRFADLAPGRYRVSVDAADIPAAQPVYVVVPPERDVLDVQIATAGSGAISLRLVDASGAALTGIPVQAYGNFGWVEGRGKFLSLHSDRDGIVHFRGLPTGHIRFSCATLLNSPWVLSKVGPVTPEGQTIHVTIRRATRVAGELRDRDGNPMASMSIQARRAGSDESVGYAETDANGRFSFKVPEGERLDLVVTGRRSQRSEDGRVSSTSTAWRGLLSGVLAGASDLVVTADDTPPVRDRSLIVRVLYSTGGPAVGVQVRADPASGRGVRAETDDTGTAHLEGLPDEEVSVQVRCGRVSDAVPPLDLPPAKLRATPGGQTLEVMFERGAEITGRVLLENGEPAPRGFVSVNTHDYRRIDVRIGKDGRFTAGGLAGLAHRLEARVYTREGELNGVVEGVIPGSDGVTIRVRQKPE